MFANQFEIINIKWKKRRRINLAIQECKLICNGSDAASRKNWTWLTPMQAPKLKGYNNRFWIQISRICTPHLRECIWITPNLKRWANTRSQRNSLIMMTSVKLAKFLFRLQRQRWQDKTTCHQWAKIPHSQPKWKWVSCKASWKKRRYVGLERKRT